MKIKDIVNRDIVNLSNCEQEPIHIPGSVQPYGFLLAMHMDTLVIDYCSGNIFDFTGVNYEQCLTKRFKDVFGVEAEAKLLEQIAQPNNVLNPPTVIETHGSRLLCTVHESGKYYVAEFEKIEGDMPDITTVYNQTIQFVSYMQQSKTLRELCQNVADQTRVITGYDRVMVYRFDKDYNGEVFAESKVDNIEPFIGLHYPHTDIPAQARLLYLTNLMRIIADVHYKPVPIYTIDDIEGKNLDMSRSYLRSVSPIHIQYLQNMGVGGTLTISLIHEGRLWGLITCHHYSARYVPLYARIAAQLQGHFLMSQINVRQLSEEYEAAHDINIALEQLLDKAYEPDIKSFQHIISDNDLLALANAGGVAILFEDKVYTAGKTPGEDDIKKLVNWLKTYSKQGAFDTSRLSDVYPDAKKFSSTGSGIIYYSLGGTYNDAIIWFAPETLEEVYWAGDPSTAVQKTEKGLTPRNSFNLWKEIKQYESRAWLKPALLAAGSFAHALQKHITLIYITEEERKQRQLTDQLREANAELENINWISSHDLKEPLRKIQLISSRVLDKEQEDLTDSIKVSLVRMNKSANRMQQLLADISAYARVRHVHDAFEPVDLNELMQRIAEDLKDELAEKDGKLTYGELPTVTGVPLLLSQMFVNLLRNSIKFTQKGKAPVIHVAMEGTTQLPEKENDTTYYKVTITDQGIGFDNKYAASIFKVFSRLHPSTEYEGSGVGLALCKKIMDNHQGLIKASGRPDEGAVFTLYFPTAVVKPEV